MAIQADLTDARLKYHQLMTGSLARVFVDQNGERVEFNAANADALSRYIKTLEDALGCGSGFAGNRPARFIF